MRSIVQRVSSGAVTCEGSRRVIARGLVVLVGLYEDDLPKDVAWMAEKIAHLRIFEDDEGKLNRSVLEIGGSVLLIPNFTVAGDASKGRRPSFDRAMRPERAAVAFDSLAAELEFRGVPVQIGFFGGDMLVEIHNDGPITIVLETQ